MTEEEFPPKGIVPPPLGSAPVYFKESIFTKDVSRKSYKRFTLKLINS